MPQVTHTISTQQSQIWQTNTGIIETDEGVILVDPGVLASEFDFLKETLGSKSVIAGFATHFHWDHILWAPELGQAPRYASAETCTLVHSNRERITKTLDDFEQHLAEQHQLGPQWDRSLFFNLQPRELGSDSIAGVACELVDVSGHADGQVALVLPDHDVAFVADTLSDVETPSITESVGHFDRYLETLGRLQGVIDRVSWIVPGHGAVADRAEAQRRLDADRRYLEYLPKAVLLAPSGQSDEELARTIAADLEETRAREGLSWDMHLGNIQLLRNGVNL